MTAAQSTVRSPAGGDRAPWATSLLTGAALVALIDLLRALMPSIVFIYGQIGSSPASDFAVIAVIVFATAAIAARTAGLNATVAVPMAAVGVMTARLGLVVAEGGQAQLLASSLGFVAAVTLLGALAASDLPSRPAARGLALGFVAHAGLNAILSSQDAIWFGGGISWIVAVATLGAIVVAGARVRPTSARPDLRITTPWLLVGPLLALHGIFALSPGGIRSGFGEAPTLTGVALVVAMAAGYLLGRVVVTSFLRDSMGVAVLLAAVLTVIATLGVTPGTVAVGSLTVAVFIPMVLVVAGETRDDVLASRGRRAAAPGLGMLVYLVVGMGYYITYQLQLGLPRAVFPAAAAALVGVILQRVEPRPDVPATVAPEDVGAIGLVPFTAALVLIASTSSVLPGRTTASYEDVRVMAYNVRMGFDLDGRFNAEALADVIRREQPDIVVLNEVDRGWALTGGHDVLALIADDLRMDSVFGPAADPIWGNAILSRLPIDQVEVRALPTGDAAMQRSALRARVDLGDGEYLGIIGTHLSHEEDEDVIRADQVAVVAEMATEMQLQGVPVVVLGDLNAEPGDGELAGLSNLVDAVALANVDGIDLATYPSDAPTVQIDHVLVSPGFGASDLSIPRSGASDHLGVAVTLRGRSRTAATADGQTGTGETAPGQG